MPVLPLELLPTNRNVSNFGATELHNAQSQDSQQRQRTTALSTVPEIHEEEELPTSNGSCKQHQIFESRMAEYLQYM